MRLPEVVLLGLALAGQLLAAEPAAAQLAPRDQESPCLSGDMLVWTEDRGSGSRIYAKRIFPNGLPKGGAYDGEWMFSEPRTAYSGQPGSPAIIGDQRWPAVHRDAMVYSVKLPGSTDYDLYAQRLSTIRKAIGSPRLIAGGPGNQARADIAPLPNGDWLVVWSDDVNDAGDIVGVRLTRALTVRGSPFPVARGVGTADEPTIAADPSGYGRYLVLWTDDRNGNKDIFGTRLTASGLPRGGPTAGQFAVVATSEDDYSPELAVTGLGTPSSSAALLLWTHDDLKDGPEVWAQQIAMSGYVVGSTLALAGGPGVQAYPTATEKQGEWLAIWVDNTLGTLDIVGVEIGTNGLSRRRVRTFVAD